MGKHWTLSNKVRLSRSKARKLTTPDQDITVIGKSAYIKLKQYKIVIDKNDLSLVRQHKWNYDHGYAVTRLLGKKIYLHRLLTRVVGGEIIDHINHNGLDNRRSNLRVCTQSVNMQNSSLSRANKSGHKGVRFNESKKRFTAYITKNRQRYNLGHFQTIDEAIKARRMAEDRLFESV